MFNKTILISLLFLAFAVPVFAQPDQRDMKKEEVIWNELKQVAPDQVENFKKATVALDANNFDEATRLYEGIMLKAPKFDHGVRRLGHTLLAAGKIEEALGLFEHALNLRCSPENLISLGRALAYPAENKQGTTAQKQRALNLLVEAFNNPAIADDPDYAILLAQVALDTDRIEPFRQATNRLASKHPELMVTHYFAAILAASDEQWLTAEAEIEKARSMGLPSEAAEAFLNSGVRGQARIWHWAIYAGILTAAWIVSFQSSAGLFCSIDAWFDAIFHTPICLGNFFWNRST